MTTRRSTLLLAGLLVVLGARSGALAEPPATRVHGGGGGSAFSVQGPDGAPLVGLRHTTVIWAGHRIVRSLRPLFLVDGEVVGREVLGRPNGPEQTTLARPGYAVGALLVRAGHRIDGFRVVFMRIGTDGLDRSDVYTSDPVGGLGGGTEQLLGGSGRVVTGIRGRHGADLDALGLLEAAPPSAQREAPVRLAFSGRVDGSEKIVITAEAARWENVHWGTSGGTMHLGGVAWNPRTQPVLPNRGLTTYLPVDVDFSTARLVKTNGRDVVNLEPGTNSVTIRIADGPNGTDLYELSILFEPVPRFAELSIRGKFDGSDEILVTAERATWRHRHWGWPTGDVLVNDTTWDTRRQPELLNDGATRYLPDDVDFATARVVHSRGRDLAGIEVADDHLIVRFADTPVGAAVYEIVVRFGPNPRPLSGRSTCAPD